jgi:MoaA/NifB/PqqE/SkfB family radical SAM enzyme
MPYVDAANEFRGLIGTHSISTLTSIRGPNQESPTILGEGTTDFGVSAIVAHLRYLLQGFRRCLWHLEVCPTSACPIECSFCSYTDRNQGGTSIPFRSVGRVLRDAERLGVVGTYFSGGGDPLAAKEIAEAIEQAASFSGVAVQTNAALLDRLLENDYCWLNMNVDLISWSIYAHNEQTFVRACQSNPLVFSRINKNIASAVDFRDRWNREHCADPDALPGVHISGKIVVHRDNFRYLRELVDFARSFALDTYHIRLVDNFEPGQDVALTQPDIGELLDSIATETDPLLVSLRRSLQRPGELGSPCPPYTINEGHIAIVETDGSVYLSIPSDGHRAYSIGNINERSLAEIWGSERHIETIHRLRSFLAPLTKDRHHKNDLAVHEFVNGARSLHLSPEMLSLRNFRLFQRPQL